MEDDSFTAWLDQCMQSALDRHSRCSSSNSANTTSSSFSSAATNASSSSAIESSPTSPPDIDTRKLSTYNVSTERSNSVGKADHDEVKCKVDCDHILSTDLLPDEIISKTLLTDNPLTEDLLTDISIDKKLMSGSPTKENLLNENHCTEELQTESPRKEDLLAVAKNPFSGDPPSDEALCRDLLNEALEFADLGGINLETAIGASQAETAVQRSHDLLNQALSQAGVNLQHEVVPDIGTIIRLESPVQYQHHPSNLYSSNPMDNSWNPYSRNYQPDHSTPIALQRKIDEQRRKTRNAEIYQQECSKYVEGSKSIITKSASICSGSLTDLSGTVGKPANFIQDTIHSGQPSRSFITHSDQLDCLNIDNTIGKPFRFIPMFTPRKPPRLEPPRGFIEVETPRRSSAIDSSRGLSLLGSSPCSALLERSPVSLHGSISPYTHSPRDSDLPHSYKKVKFGVRLIKKVAFSPYDLISPGSLVHTPRKRSFVPNQSQTDREEHYQSQADASLDHTWLQYKIGIRKSV